MSNLFKTAKASDLYVPPTLGAGGINAGFLGGRNGGTAYANPTAARSDLVSGLSNTGAEAANTFGNLYSTIAPGFNDLLSARLNTFNDSARSAIGNLRENLSSRRVLGSSFGQDTLTRANAEFQRGRDNIVADNFLKSLDAQRQLTQDKYNASKQQFQAGLDELNLEAGIAQNFAGMVNQQFAKNAQIDAEAQNKANQNYAGAIVGVGSKIAGSLFGPTFSGAGNALAGSFGF